MRIQTIVKQKLRRKPLSRADFLPNIYISCILLDLVYYIPMWITTINTMNTNTRASRNSVFATKSCDAWLFPIVSNEVTSRLIAYYETGASESIITVILYSSLPYIVISFSYLVAIFPSSSFSSISYILDSLGFIKIYCFYSWSLV